MQRKALYNTLSPAGQFTLNILNSLGSIQQRLPARRSLTNIRTISINCLYARYPFILLGGQEKSWIKYPSQGYKWRGPSGARSHRLLSSGRV